MVDIGGDKSKFILGQLIGQGIYRGVVINDENQLQFIPGRMGHTMDENQKLLFIPGQNVTTSDGLVEFQPGQMVPGTKKGQQLQFLRGEIMINGKGQIQFLPGIQVDGNFVPGLIEESKEGCIFIEGKLHKVKTESLFIPGTTSVFSETSNRFVKANNDGEIGVHTSPETALVIDGTVLSTVFKKTKPKNGVTVIGKDGAIHFYADGQIPDNLEGSEVISGRMECGVDGPKFVPGKVMMINGVKTFIPGKLIKGNNIRK